MARVEQDVGALVAFDLVEEPLESPENVACALSLSRWLAFAACLSCCVAHSGHTDGLSRRFAGANAANWGAYAGCTATS